VPTQSAQCWFPGLAISNEYNYFSNKIYVSNFIKQHSETVMFLIMILLVWQPIGWISYKQNTVIAKEKK